MHEQLTNLMLFLLAFWEVSLCNSHYQQMLNLVLAPFLQFARPNLVLESVKGKQIAKSKQN